MSGENFTKIHKIFTKVLQEKINRIKKDSFIDI